MHIVMCPWICNSSYARIRLDKLGKLDIFKNQGSLVCNMSGCTPDNW